VSTNVTVYFIYDTAVKYFDGPEEKLIIGHGPIATVFQFSGNCYEKILIQLSLMARICRNCDVSCNDALFESILSNLSDSVFNHSINQLNTTDALLYGVSKDTCSVNAGGVMGVHAVWRKRRIVFNVVL